MLFRSFAVSGAAGGGVCSAVGAATLAATEVSNLTGTTVVPSGIGPCTSGGAAFVVSDSKPGPLGASIGLAEAEARAVSTGVALGTMGEGKIAAIGFGSGLNTGEAVGKVATGVDIGTAAGEITTGVGAGCTVTCVGIKTFGVGVAVAVAISSG